jgi:hypothetical protein
MPQDDTGATAIWTFTNAGRGPVCRTGSQRLASARNFRDGVRVTPTRVSARKAGADAVTRVSFKIARRHSIRTQRRMFMAHIVAGLFEDQVAADQALKSLRERGVAANDMNTFIVNPPGMHHGLPLGGDEAADKEARGGEEGAVRGAAIGGAAGVAAGLLAAPLGGPVGIAAGIGAGAFVGALAGAASSMGDETKHEPTARPGGVMVAVNVEHVPAAEVVEQMRASAAKLIEVEEGDWRDGTWRDFDPVRPPRHVVAVAGNPNYPT